MRAAVVASAASCYAAAGAQAVESLTSQEPWDWVAMLVNWALYGVMAAVIALLVRAGSFVPADVREGRALVATAVRTGELPAGARSDVWLPLLAQEEREARRARRVTFLLSQVIAALVAVAALVADGSVPGVWALAGALAVFAVLPIGWLGRRARRAEGLRAAVAP